LRPSGDDHSDQHEHHNVDNDDHNHDGDNGYDNDTCDHNDDDDWRRPDTHDAAGDHVCWAARGDTTCTARGRSGGGSRVEPADDEARASEGTCKAGESRSRNGRLARAKQSW
jgi:hypothetical protein